MKRQQNILVEVANRVAEFEMLKCKFNIKWASIWKETSCMEKLNSIVFLCTTIVESFSIKVILNFLFACLPAVSDWNY